MKHKTINGKVYNIEEHVSEVLARKCEIDFVSEYNGRYYMHLKQTDGIDNTIWEIDKKDGHIIAPLSFGPQYLCTGIMDKAKLVDPKVVYELSNKTT